MGIIDEYKRAVDRQSKVPPHARFRIKNMSEFSVGDLVRIEDVSKGRITRVEEHFIQVNGIPRSTVSEFANGTTRTITILEKARPAEPILIGAVVKDSSGVLWSLDEPEERILRWRMVGHLSWSNWEDIEGPEIMFEGVS